MKIANYDQFRQFIVKITFDKALEKSGVYTPDGRRLLRMLEHAWPKKGRTMPSSWKLKSNCLQLNDCSVAMQKTVQEVLSKPYSWKPKVEFSSQDVVKIVSNYPFTDEDVKDIFNIGNARVDFFGRYHLTMVNPIEYPAKLPIKKVFEQVKYVME